mmetsp:Transcript_9062/g.28292  ORF Transcript_9062/g.28292 Transcript_9062/m.28292 type:complete len:453 (-) Transcript_9062:54-1412(-)
MDWSRFPDALALRILLAAVSALGDVAALQALERRARRLAPKAAWALAVAGAELGAGVCAALSCSTGGHVDWLLAVRSAASGRLRCTPAPGLRDANADRSGHACEVLRGTRLVVFGGARRRQTQQGHAEAVADIAVLDLVHLQWLEVQDHETCDPVPSVKAPGPAPRVRPTLTKCNFGCATLVGGQTFAGPGTGHPFGDVWRLECEEHSAGKISFQWHEVEAGGCVFPSRSCHTAVRAPCGLLVIGGAGPGGHVLPCEAYCLADGAWHLPEQSGLLPPQGALHHGCYHRGCVVLVGGIDDAGLQRRGLGRPTDVHLLHVATWAWERLARHPLTPPLHSRSAALLLGSRLLVVGGDPGSPAGQSDDVAVLDLDTATAPSACPAGARQAVWSAGQASGPSFAAAGHSLVGGVLLGGHGRVDGQAPAALLLPDLGTAPAAAAPAGRTARVPRWFKR